MLKIGISAETDTWYTRAPDSNDSWDRGDTAGRVSNVTAFVDRNDGYYRGCSLAKDMDVQLGDTIYAVVADYEVGSTFGRSGGHSQVLDAFTTEEEAAALLEAAKADNGYGFTHNGQNYNRNWVGYFESLNELTVWECEVRRHPDDPIRKGPGRYSLKRGH